MSCLIKHPRERSSLAVSEANGEYFFAHVFVASGLRAVGPQPVAVAASPPRGPPKANPSLKRWLV